MGLGPEHATGNRHPIGAGIVVGKSLFSKVGRKAAGFLLQPGIAQVDPAEPPCPAGFRRNRSRFSFNFILRN